MTKNLCNLWLKICEICVLFFLTVHSIFTLVVSALQNHLFMQNEPNFRKSQMNVNKVLTMNYDIKDTWWSGKTKPIQSQFKPIKANKMPKQSQFKPKQTQSPLRQGPANPQKIIPITALSRRALI